ncbi:MAG TPA: ParB/RepB/Spo0J family partition protein [Candidatus Saccharimonadales bacterium]|jgi:ParB family chromosome partitioning protein
MESPTKRGLGKGFEALLPTDFDKSILLSPEDRIEKIPVDKLSPNPSQPRRYFDETSLSELSASIKHYGVLQPLLVTPDKDRYIIVAGERRWRAAKQAKLKTVPVVIHKRQELEQIEIALIENVQREDLKPLEQALSIEKLHEQFNFTYEDIAKRLGKATSTVTNIVRLLKLPAKAKEALNSGQITEGHARQIIAIPDQPERQEYLLNAIIKNGWNVRQAEQFVTSLKTGIKETDKASDRTSAETSETKKLSKKLGTKVFLKRMAHGGRLEITYKSDEELTKIINLFF